MLIMPSTSKDFPGMAQAIADEFFKNGTPLEDGIVHTAVEHKLTPEEVKRLVEKTNTTASIQLLRNEENKKRVFDLAEFDAVLKRTHPTDDDAQESVDSQYEGLPQTRDEADEKALEAQEEKTASVKQVCSLPGGVTKLASHIFQARKLLEEAKREKFASEMKIRDDIDHIISDFSVQNPTFFQKFASDGIALYGSTANTILTHVAAYLGEEMPLEKSAGIIDDRQPLLKVLGDACERIEKLAQQEAEIKELSEAIQAYTAMALKGDA